MGISSMLVYISPPAVGFRPTVLVSGAHFARDPKACLRDLTMVHNFIPYGFLLISYNNNKVFT